MKKKSILYGALLILIIFIASATFYWFKYFLDLGSNGTLTNNAKGTLVLSDENKVYSIYDEDVSHIGDTAGYKFKVENRGVSTERYRLLLKEVSPSKIKDGCTKNTLLKASELHYQLYLNKVLYKEGELDEVSNGVLEERLINIDITDSYELKVWVNDDATNTEGKHYHYEIKLEVVEE